MHLNASPIWYNAGLELKQADMEKLSKELRGRVGPSGIISTDIVPPDATGNNVTIEVKAGDNTQDFALKKPAD